MDKNSSAEVFVHPALCMQLFEKVPLLLHLCNKAKAIRKNELLVNLAFICTLPYCCFTNVLKRHLWQEFVSLCIMSFYMTVSLCSETGS